jgi:hypothetical protein
MNKVIAAPTMALLTSLILSISPACSMPADRESRANQKGVAIAEKRGLDAVGKELAVKGAKGIEKILNKAVDEKVITVDDLFDENYVLISPSPPLKFRTRFDSFLDKSIQSFEDSILTSDLRADYAIAVDRNGYLPTHNSKFSKPLTGDPDTDLANNRGKRFFNDKLGIAAARNKGEVLVQCYERDNGQKLCDFAAPIFVKGKHWGAFRIAMRRE